MDFLYNEASKLRKLIDVSLKLEKNLPLFGLTFPINYCKQASILFAYHLQQIGFLGEIECVLGFSNTRDNQIGHWWVKIGNVMVDLTADQFNGIEDCELSYKIKKGRPFKSVYCCTIGESPHNKIFNMFPSDSFFFDCNDLNFGGFDCLQ